MRQQSQSRSNPIRNNKKNAKFDIYEQSESQSNSQQLNQISQNFNRLKCEQLQSKIVKSGEMQGQQEFRQKQGQGQNQKLLQQPHPHLSSIDIKLEQDLQQKSSANKLDYQQNAFTHYLISENNEMLCCRYCSEYIEKHTSSFALRFNNHVVYKHPQKISSFQQVEKEGKVGKQHERVILYQIAFISPRLKRFSKRKSLAWAHFNVHQEISMGVCRHCGCNYTIKDGSTSGMLKHLKTNHNIQKSKEQAQPKKVKKRRPSRKMLMKNARQLHRFPSVNEQPMRRQYNFRKFVNQKMLYEIYVKSEPYIHPAMLLENFHAFQEEEEVLEVIKNMHWYYHRTGKLFAQLNLLEAVAVQENHIEKVIANVHIMTKNMRKKFYHFGDCVTLIECLSPTEDLNIHSVIYWVGQSDRAEPVLLNLTVIYKSNKKSYELMLQSFFEGIIAMVPKTTILCGTSIFGAALKLILTKYNCSVILNNQKGGKINDIKLDNAVESAFVGLHCFHQYVQKIKKLLPINTCRPLSQLLMLAFYYEYNSQKKGSEKVSMNQLLIQMPCFSTAYMISNNLYEIQSVVSKLVFQKIYYCYVLGRCSYYLEPVNCNTMLARPKRQNKLQISTMKYSLQKQCWECSCKFLIWTGIPCPHLMACIYQFNGSIRYYVNERWIFQPMRTARENNEFFMHLLRQEYMSFEHWKEDQMEQIAWQLIWL